MSCRVWSRFQKARSEGSLVKLRIQDLPENRIDEALELFVKYYVNEEALLIAAGVPHNPKAVAEYALLLTESMKDPTSHNVICCEDSDGVEVGPIVGVSMMSLVEVAPKNSPQLKKIKLETEEMRLYKKLDEVSNLNKHMEELHIPHYYDDMGMVVHPLFRKLGIAMEFARARRLACVAHNVAATGAITTSRGTERVAKKDNWETVLEVNLEDLGQQHGVTFEGCAASRLVIWKNPHFTHHARNI